jgi:hypothetical protein
LPVELKFPAWTRRRARLCCQDYENFWGKNGVHIG